MQQTPPILRQSAESGSRGAYIVLCLLLVLFGLIGLAVYGVTGFFRLSGETGVLRDCMLTAVAGQAEKKIALNVGPITTGVVRLGSRFFSVPPEPRAALEAFRSGEVGIYKLNAPVSDTHWGAIIGRADKAMARRGWLRIVGVAQHHELVAVYIPEKGVGAGRLGCCVMVLSGSDFVLVAARAKLNPLLDLARDRVDIAQQFRPLAAAGLR